ncbi:MAG: TolC family protein [Polyangiales bacterium]|jgi:cobalt-zinc-cadmium efflux system outer membrane protein
MRGWFSIAYGAALPRARAGVLAAVALLVVAVPVLAQEELPPALRLDDAQRLAQAEAPDVMLSTARAVTARTEIGVAGMFPNPQFTIGATSGTSVFFGSFYIALPLFGQRRSAMEAADAQARVAAAGVEVTGLDARLAVTLAWLDLWQLEGESRIATSNAARRDRILDTARARFSEGASPRLDVLRAETDARRARAEVASLQERRLAAAARLAVLVSRDESLTVEIEGEPRMLESQPDLVELETFTGDHPLTRRANAMLRAAGAVVTRERRARRPLFGVQVGGAFFDRAPPPNHDAVASLKADLPFFNRHLIARAESARDTARTELETVMIQLRARIASARSDYLAAVRLQEAQVGEVLPAAQEAADLSDEAYQSGGLDLTGVLAAEQALSDARLTALRATADRARALSALEHAAGRAL